MGIDLRWGNRINLEITREESFDVSFDVINRDGTTVDLTGWTVKMLLSKAPCFDDDQAIEIYEAGNKLSIDGSRVIVKGMLANAAIKAYCVKIISPDSSLTLYPYFGEVIFTEI